MMTVSDDTHYFGWDIGGAHLKLAELNQNGQWVKIEQWSCPLWQGIEALDSLFNDIAQHKPVATSKHAITMTGELVDAFPHRQAGVEAILQSVEKHLPPAQSFIFASGGRWLNTETAKDAWQSVASMNWQATALLAAQQISEGVIIDVGSTTTDIIPFQDEKILDSGETDQQRQLTGSLVYTGAIRTPLMAISHHAPVQGQMMRLANEWFATSGDIWRLKNELSSRAIQDPSADGQSWQEKDCQQRIARMLACDRNDIHENAWPEIVDWFANQQQQQIREALLGIIRRYHFRERPPIIGLGVGRFISQACAQELGHPYIDFADLCQNNRDAASYAPAAALALLAKQQLS
jgi:probable H4MPT-linked C1 transfer pathway protein